MFNIYNMQCLIRFMREFIQRTMFFKYFSALTWSKSEFLKIKWIVEMLLVENDLFLESVLSVLLLAFKFRPNWRLTS